MSGAGGEGRQGREAAAGIVVSGGGGGDRGRPRTVWDGHTYPLDFFCTLAVSYIFFLLFGRRGFNLHFFFCFQKRVYPSSGLGVCEGYGRYCPT